MGIADLNDSNTPCSDEKICAQAEQFSASEPTLCPSTPTPSSLNIHADTKTVVLHIGYEKTGSSAIQAFCARNRDWLKKKNIEYPLVGTLPQHSLLYAEINSKSPRRIHAIIRETRKQIDSSTCQTVVFSHESLHLLRPQVFQDMFAGYNTQVVAYLRNPSQAAISHFATMIRFGRLPIHDIGQAIRIYSQTLISCFDYYWELEAFANAFGRENLSVRHYSPDNLVGGQSTSDFMHLLQVDQIPVTAWPGARANPSIDADQFLFISQVARQLKHMPRNRILKITKELCDVLIKKAPPQKDRPFEMLVQPNLKRAIDRYFEPNLRPLYDRYFQGEAVFESAPAVEHDPITIDPNRAAKFTKILRKSKLVPASILENIESESTNNEALA